MEFYNHTAKTMEVSGEPYRNMVNNHLAQKGLKIEDFDVLIGPEGVSGGKQMCIRNPKVAAQVKDSMSFQKAWSWSASGSTGGASPPSSGGGSPPVSGKATPAPKPPAATAKPDNDNASPRPLTPANDNAVPRTPPSPKTAPGEDIIRGKTGGIKQAVTTIGFQLLLVGLAAYLQRVADQMRMKQMWEAKNPELNNKLIVLSPKIIELRQKNPNSPIYANLTIEYQYSRVPISDGEGNHGHIEMFLDFGNVTVDVSTNKIETEKIGKTDYLPGITVLRTIAEVAVELDIPTENERQRNKRAEEQLALVQRLRQLEQQRKATAPAKKEVVPQPPSTPPSSFLPTPEPEPSFVPGAPGRDPIKEAAEWVKRAETYAVQLVTEGMALLNRTQSNNSPTQRERQNLFDKKNQWQYSLKYMRNWFKDQSREEAVQELNRILEQKGNKLNEICTSLGEGSALS